MSKRPPRVPSMRRPGRRPATIVDWIEAQDGPKPLGLSEPSKTWIDRMWHAVIRVETSDADFTEFDERFVAYLKALEDQQEAELANAVFMFLMDLIESHFDELPKCSDCGSIICPNCGRQGSRPAA